MAVGPTDGHPASRSVLRLGILLIALGFLGHTIAEVVGALATSSGLSSSSPLGQYALATIFLLGPVGSSLLGAGLVFCLFARQVMGRTNHGS